MLPNNPQPQSFIVDAPHNNSPKKIIFALLGIAFLVGGVIAGILLVRERQLISQKAAANCPGGSVGACADICRSGCGGSSDPQACVNGCPGACENICSGGSGNVCGNGQCNAPGETSGNCPQDCGGGAPPPQPPPPSSGSCPTQSAGNLCNPASCGEQGRCDGSGPLSCIVCPGGTVFAGQNRCSLFNSGAQVASDCGGYTVGQTSACGGGSVSSCQGKSAGAACGTNSACVKGDDANCTCQSIGQTGTSCDSTSAVSCGSKRVGDACLAAQNANGVCEQNGGSGSSVPCLCKSTIDTGNSELGCGTAGQPACTCASNQWRVYSCDKCNPSGGCQDTFVGNATNATVDGMVGNTSSCSMRQADCVGSSPTIFKTRINCTSSCYATNPTPGPGSSPIASNPPTGGTPSQTNPPSDDDDDDDVFITAQCLVIKAFDENWNQLTMDQVASKSSGDVVRFTVSGSTTGGVFDKARFTVNGSLRPEVSLKRPGTQEFYDEYTIPAQITTLKIEAEIHHNSLGWN